MLHLEQDPEEQQGQNQNKTANAPPSAHQKRMYAAYQEAMHSVSSSVGRQRPQPFSGACHESAISGLVHLDLGLDLGLASGLGSERC